MQIPDDEHEDIATHVEEMDKPWRSETILRHYYHGENLSAKEVSERLDCSRTTIQNWLEKHDIPKRSRGTQPKAIRQVMRGD